MSSSVFKYSLTPTTRLLLQQGDITKFHPPSTAIPAAIVNAANERMLGGGGVDGAIHRAAGPDLYQACLQVPEVSDGVRCPTGEARITPGAFGSLNVQHIIHTVGPVYHTDSISAPLLESCYRNSLKLAHQHGLKSLAFPAISCGVYGYPVGAAARIALETLRDEQQKHENNDTEREEGKHIMIEKRFISTCLGTRIWRRGGMLQMRN